MFSESEWDIFQVLSSTEEDMRWVLKLFRIFRMYTYRLFIMYYVLLLVVLRKCTYELIVSSYSVGLCL